MIENDEELTEETIEGIYADFQHRIESIPGYAEAFKRVSVFFQKIFDGVALTEAEECEFGQVCGELLLLQMMQETPSHP